MKTVTVQFKKDYTSVYQGNEYSYTSHDDSIQPGDYVVVDTPSTGFVVVKVKNVIPYEVTKATKCIVCKVDQTKYKEEQERREQVLRIKDQLEAKLKKFNEVSVYQLLAQHDPEAAALVSLMKSLSN